MRSLDALQHFAASRPLEWQPEVHCAAPLSTSSRKEPFSHSEGNFTDSAIAMQQVCKSYTRGGAVTQVLKSVSLEVRSGQAVFLLGPSGSGKTTLMSIMGALLSQDSGEVYILGNNLAGLNHQKRAELRRRRLGFVFQKFHLIRGLTAAENVALPLKLDGAANASSQKKALSLLERVGLADKAHEHPQRLSVGQCQRVAVARALAADPDIVLADEPTASLDAESGLAAIRLLRELTVECGKTLVVVTHDHRIVPKASSTERIVAMDSGSIVEDGIALSQSQLST